MAFVALSSTITIRLAPRARFLASRTEIRSPENSPSFVRRRIGLSVNSPLPWMGLFFVRSIYLEWSKQFGNWNQCQIYGGEGGI